MKARNPFTLAPYGSGDAERFFGREREIRCLMGRVVSDRVVLVHAQMGAGKSSLVSAGVIQQLRQSGFEVGSGVRPSEIPGVTDPAAFRTPEGRLSPVCILQTLARGLVATEAIVDGTANEFVNKGRGGANGKGVAIVIDQLEEIFTHSAFPLNDVRTFFEVLAALAAHSDLWMILVVRDDYLGRTLAQSARVGSFLESRFAVPMLSKRTACRVVAHCLGYESAVSDPTIANVVNAAVRAGSAGAERAENLDDDAEAVLPLLLRVVCYSWFDAAVRGAGVLADGRPSLQDLAAVDIGDGFGDDALVAYIDAAMKQAATVGDCHCLADESALRQWCEDELVDRGARAKARIPEGSDRAIRCLAEQYFVSINHQSGATAELAHDSFAKALQESNRRWFDRRGLVAKRCRDWTRGDKAARFLLSRVEYRQAQEQSADATPEESGFVALSGRELRRSMRHAAAVVGVVAVFSALLVGVAWFARMQAAEKARHFDDMAKSAELTAGITSLRTDAALAAQSAWFSAYTLRDDEVALGHALRSVLLARTYDRTSGYAASGGNAETSPALPMSLSVLQSRLSSDRMVRRRILGEGKGAGSWRFAPDGSFESCNAVAPAPAGDTSPQPCARLPAEARFPIGQGYVQGVAHHVHSELAGGNGRKLPFGFARLDRSGGADGIVLALDEKSGVQAQFLTGSQRIPSGETDDEIALSRFAVRDGKLFGASILRRGGVAYGWSIRQQELDSCTAATAICAKLTLEFVERLVGNNPVDAWLEPDEGRITLRTISSIGEWAEIKKWRNARGTVGPGNRNAQPADIVEYDGDIVFVTKRDWCAGAACRDGDAYTRFAQKKETSVFPVIVFPAVRESADRAQAWFSAVGRDGATYEFDVRNATVVASEKKLWKTGEVLLGLRLPGDKAGLVMRNEGKPQHRVAAVRAGADGKLAYLPTVANYQHLLDPPDARILSAHVSDSGLLGVVLESAQPDESLVSVCQLRMTATDVTMGACGRTGSPLPRGATSIAISPSVHGRSLLAVGGGAGTIGLFSVSERADSRLQLDALTEIGAHVGEITALQWITASEGLRLVSGGRDGAILNFYMPGAGASDGIAAWQQRFRGTRWIPSVLSRQKLPVLRLVGGESSIYAATADSTLLRIETDTRTLIALACDELNGRYPEEAAADTGVIEQLRRFVQIRDVCSRAARRTTASR